MSGVKLLLSMVCLSAGWIATGQARKAAPIFVAFSVGKTRHQFGQGRVTYEKVFLNLGGGYNADDHVFIAPTNGIYHISFSGLNHVTSTKKTELFLDLYKNNDYMLSAFESKQVYGQSGNSILLQLLVGDRVYITARNEKSGLYGTPDQVYATFSGYLVVPIYQVTTYIAGVVDTQPTG